MSFAIHFRIAPYALIFSSLLVPAATAQPVAREVTVIALDGPAERDAMVYRRTVGPDRDVIALAPQATADDLEQAFRMLAILDAHADKTPTGNFMAAVRSERASPVSRPADDTRRKRYEEYVRAVKQSSPRNVSGFGKVRSIRVAVAAP